jgi:hypothetical protein
MSGKTIAHLKESDFHAFINNFCTAAETYADLLGIPANVRSDLSTKRIAYNTAYDTCEKPNAGKIDRKTRQETRDDLTGFIKKVKKAYLDADLRGVVTSVILTDFGYPPKDTTHTNVPQPTDVVPFNLSGGNYLQIVVTHPAKPQNYNGAVAFYIVGPQAVTEHSALTSSKLLTRRREIFTFEDSQLNKTFSLALCWENGKGELGPYSPIQSRRII